MISSPFSGNFGNSLTEYILTRCVAEYNGYDFGFNPKFNYDYHNGYNQLDFLNLDYGRQHNSNFDEMPEGVDKIWNEKYKTITYSNGDSVDWHDFQPDVFRIEDSTKLVIRCCQNARYFNSYKEDIRRWISIQPLFLEYIKSGLESSGIILNRNTCIINCRGGEYKTIPHVMLTRQYYDSAMDLMLQRNPNMKFVVITDDPSYYQYWFPNISVMHLSIAGDYITINHAQNLILSNSSFVIFPTYLNENLANVIAPKFWARHNVSTGYWANSDMTTFGWDFMDREGNIS